MGRLQVKLIRIDRLLAEAGVASRRGAIRLLKQGLVEVNGRRVLDPATKIDPEKDTVTVRGAILNLGLKKYYYKFYKPEGFITSTQDKKPTIMDLLPKDLPGRERIFPAGRLDKDAEGLLLLTDDGLLAHRVMHPKWKLPKVYEVSLNKKISEETVAKIKQGVELSDGVTLPCEIEFLDDSLRFLQVKVIEGRYHLIKRMFSSFGFKVLKLKRIAIGPVELEKLKKGEIAPITEEELRCLKKAIGLK